MNPRAAYAAAFNWTSDGEPGTTRFVPASSLAGRPVPPREWHVDGFVPGRTVTMLGGPGGAGKSLLALQLAVATAAARPWLGRQCAGGGVIYVSAEDDLDELHRRLADIATAESLELADLDRLTLCSLVGEDALLATLVPGKGSTLLPTPLHHELDARLQTEEPALLVLDTLADLHNGAENDRSTARQFIGLLRGLAIRHECAVLLLAHPSLTGMSSGSGLSGSTAWDASVRSRLYLERIPSENFEPDPDRRRLTVKKSNYASLDTVIEMSWRSGVFVADAQETGLDRAASSGKATRVFLKLLRLFNEQGRHVSPTPSVSYAPSVFAKHLDAEGCTTRALRAAMETLLAGKQIIIRQHGRGNSQRQHLEVNS